MRKYLFWPLCTNDYEFRRVNGKSYPHGGSLICQTFKPAGTKKVHPDGNRTELYDFYTFVGRKKSSEYSFRVSFTGTDK